jgi:hypothetical protein
MGKGVVAVAAAVLSLIVVSAGPAMARVSWVAEVTANPGSNDSLAAVSCVTQADCVAVGAYVTAGSQTAALAEHWDGSSWTAQPVPGPASSYTVLNDVSCAVATSCLALGSYIVAGTDPPQFRSLGARWDGSSWHRIPVPAGLGTLSCPAAGTCIAVGERGKTLVADEWNGSSWAMLPAPAPVPSGTGFFSSISCTLAAACTAVGAQGPAGHPSQVLAERWNGHRWALQPTPPLAAGGGLSSVSCASVSVCTAVGFQDSTNPYLRPGELAERWAGGGSWTLQPTPNVPQSENGLTGVSCVSVRYCTAVGVREAGKGGQYMTALHWNGTSWTQQAPLPGYDLVIQSVSCQRGTGCTAVGFIQDNLFGEAPPATVAAHN